MSKEYCIFLQDRFSTPRIARVDSIVGDTVHITEGGYGFHSHPIKSKQIVGFGSRKELSRMLPLYIMMDKQVNKCRKDLTK